MGGQPQSSFHLERAMCISVLGKNPPACRGPDLSGSCGRQRSHVLRDFCAITSDQNLFAWFEEHLDAVPFIANNAPGGARGLEQACGRREAEIAHAPSI